MRLTFRGENPEMSISVLNASLLTFALSYLLTCYQHELQYQSPTQDGALKVRAHLHLSLWQRLNIEKTYSGSQKQGNIIVL